MLEADLALLNEVADLLACAGKGLFPGIGVSWLADWQIEHLLNCPNGLAQAIELAACPTRHMIGDEAVGLRLSGHECGLTGRDPIGLAVDAGDAIAEGSERWKRTSLHAEEMKLQCLWEAAIQEFDDGDQPFGAVKMAAAHRADAERLAELDEVGDRLEGSDIVLWETALYDRHEAVRDAGVACAYVTGAIELDRTGDPVEDLVSIMRDCLFDAQIEAGEAPEWMA